MHGPCRTFIGHCLAAIGISWLSDLEFQIQRTSKVNRDKHFLTCGIGSQYNIKHLGYLIASFQKSAPILLMGIMATAQSRRCCDVTIMARVGDARVE